MNKKYLLALAASTLMFAACGDEVTEIHQDGMAVLEKGEKLSKQACDEANVGEMLFVMDSSEVFFCDGKSWQTLKGEKGADGTDGSDGKDGKDGKDGVRGEKGDKGSKGDSGKDGDNGTSCTAKSVKNKAGLEGVEVTCGKTVVDTIWNGEKGDSGKDGDNGTSCTAKSVKNKAGLEGLEVTCGETVVDTIWNGEKGDNGEAGKSAYEIAKENGFEGTEAEWLESMKGPFIQDKRDGKIYKTVKIGDQVWMAENLNYSVNPGKQSWCYNDSAEYCEKYGRLYTWAAAIDSVALANDKDNPQTCGYLINCTLPTVVQGVCPEGWHLPDTTEWRKLLDAVGGQDDAGKMLKSANGWNDDEGSSGNGLDAYGFSALPAGDRRDNGNFYYAGYDASFWSASEYDGGYAYYVDLLYRNESAYMVDYGKYYGFSVRCLQN